MIFSKMRFLVLMMVVLLSPTIEGYRKCCSQNKNLRVPGAPNQPFTCEEKDPDKTQTSFNFMDTSPDGVGLPKCNEYQYFNLEGKNAIYNSETDRLHVTRYNDSIPTDRFCLEEISSPYGRFYVGITCNQCKEEAICINSCCPFKGPCHNDYGSPSNNLLTKFNDLEGHIPKYIFVGPIDDADFFECNEIRMIHHQIATQYLDREGMLHVQEGSDSNVYDFYNFCVIEDNRFVICKETKTGSFVVEGIEIVFDMDTIDIMSDGQDLPPSVGNRTDMDTNDDPLPEGNINCVTLRNLEEKMDSMLEKVNAMLDKKLDNLLKKLLLN